MAGIIAANANNGAGIALIGDMSPKNPKAPPGLAVPSIASCSAFASWRVASTFASTSCCRTIGVMATARIARSQVSTRIHRLLWVGFLSIRLKPDTTYFLAPSAILPP